MVRRRFLFSGYLAVALGLTCLTSGSSLRAQTQTPAPTGPPGPQIVMGVPCDSVSDLGIDKQMNLRAAMIMVGCGLVPGGGPDTLDGGPVPALPSAPGNVDVITDPETYPRVTQSESMVWSSDGKTIVVNYNDSRDSNTTPINLGGLSVSTDGGATFRRILPSPLATGHGANFGDPIVVFNAKLGLWFAGDLVNGCGGQGVGLWTSTNGQMWTTGVCAHTGPADDRESMWVDNNPDSPFYGRMYISFNNFVAGARLSVTWSDDGISWSTPALVSTSFIRNVQLTGSPSDGSVFVAAMDEGNGGGNNRTNFMYRSTDGGTTWTEIKVGAPFAPPGRFVTLCGSYFYAIAPIWRHMGWGQPGIGPDGVVHYAYAGKGVNPGDLGDIYYTRSLDNGNTWSDPIVLNSDQAVGGAREQWMPSLSVTTSGGVQVSWYDRRSTIDRSYEVWGVHSSDNGATWENDARISSTVIPQPEQPDPVIQRCYAGDYNYASALGDTNYVTWTDGRVPVSGHPQQDVFFAPGASADFIFTDNNVAGPNTVSAYKVGGNGSLTPVPGSPFSTGGLGSGVGFFASGRITTSVVGKFLYAANDGSDDVSAFSIDQQTGVLTPVPGSPFDTGGAAGGQGLSLAATPDNRFLYSANGFTQDITTFGINPDGSLTRIGSNVFTFQQPDGIKVTPDGSFLAVVLPNAGPHGSVAIFSIQSDGTLLSIQPPQPVRPFGGPDGGATGIDVTCDATTVTVAESSGGSTLVDVFTLNHDTGLLTGVQGSPFNPPVGVNSNVPLLSVGDQFLFVSNQASNTITVLNVGPFSLNGVFSAGGTGTPAGLATDQAGTHLFAAKFPGSISVFNIGGDGSLTLALGSPVSTGQPPGLESLTVFPAKTCASAARPSWTAWTTAKAARR
jgi:6-phosphogluconolactonase